MAFTSTIDAALWLAAKGTPCFPCGDTKAPTCPAGFKAATKDASTLVGLWTSYPGTLIGVPTGAITGIDILDIDPRHGGDKWLQQVQSTIPTSQTHHTRSGGLHILFKHHAGMRNSSGKIADGIDVRGDGGYVIWWPLMGLDHQNGGILADWPQWLIQQLTPVTKPFAAYPIQQNNRYAQGALQKAASTVATSKEGSRNQQLNNQVYSLARFIVNGDLSAQQIAVELSRAALAAGLGRDEIINTITSALRAQGV